MDALREAGLVTFLDLKMTGFDQTISWSYMKLKGALNIYTTN